MTVRTRKSEKRPGSPPNASASGEVSGDHPSALRATTGTVGVPVDIPRKPSKFRNVPNLYNGVRYQSRAEANYAQRLDLEKRSGAVRWWIGQPTFRLGCAINVYRPDFLVIDEESEAYAVDVKGAETAKFRRDKKLWAAYGPCDLWVVKGKKVEIIKPEPKP